MNDPLPLVIANLKANKTWDEISTWIEQVEKQIATFKGTVILCPSYPFLAASAVKIKSENSRIKLASQDLSRFEQGAYTGEVSASQIAEIVSYAIIGHSERRRNFAENDEVLAQKVQNAKNAKIIPIFCVQGPDTSIPEGVEIVAYEPIFAIGTANPDTPENTKAVSQKLKAKSDYIVIYGGSVTAENTKSFLEKGIIDGVLVGTNSLDPQNFSKIVNSASF